MNWINRLQRKYGRYGIKDLMKYIVAANALVFVLFLVNPLVIRLLSLDPALVLRGQIWRLVTFIFIPPSFDLIWIVFTLYFYYLVGTELERTWGTFKFNLYYAVGMIATILASFLVGFGANAVYINLSLFFAFAHLYPDFELLVFLVLPVKIKYLAALSWIYIGYTVLFGYWQLKALALVSLANYFLFFSQDIMRMVRFKRQVYQNRRRFFSEVKKKRTK